MWQLLGRSTTASQLPLVAAAWQPTPAAAAAVADAGAAASKGHLIAVLDRQHVYLLSCTPPEQQQRQQHVATSTVSAGTAAAGSSVTMLRLLSCCGVPNASQQQLSSVAWSDGSTVCVGDSEGGCQVLQVRGFKESTVHAGTCMDARSTPEQRQSQLQLNAV
jgi:hypothetical protein